MRENKDKYLIDSFKLVLQFFLKHKISHGILLNKVKLTVLFFKLK